MDYMQFVIDYVEGRVPFDTFYSRVMTDDSLAEWLEQRALPGWQCYPVVSKETNFQIVPLPFSIRYWFDMLARESSVGSVKHRVEVQVCMTLLIRKHYPNQAIHPDPSDNELSCLLLDACPSYVDGPEVWKSGVIEKIANECPKEWSKTKKKAHIKARIIEEFHLEDKKHPRWWQSPEWPFSDGKPMKYVKTTVKYKNEWYQHHFVNPETGEERIVDDMS